MMFFITRCRLLSMPGMLIVGNNLQIGFGGEFDKELVMSLYGFRISRERINGIRLVIEVLKERRQPTQNE